MPHDDADDLLDDEDWYDDEGDLGDEERDQRSRFYEEDSAHCPDCGAEVFRDADFCPKCGYWITELDRQKMSASAGGLKPWVKATVVVVLVTFVLGTLGFIALLF